MFLLSILVGKSQNKIFFPATTRLWVQVVLSIKYICIFPATTISNGENPIFEAQDYAVVDDERKKWVLQSLGKKYRDYKKDIKDKYYSSWNTDEERLQHRPPDVSSEDWAWLVQYWGSPEVQAVAAKNKANRSSQKLRHTGGTKSFARHRDEEMRSRTDGSNSLFLLKRGGEEIFAGPLGHNSCQLISYFEVTTEAQEEALGVDFAEIYKNSDQFRRTKALVEELSKPPPGSTDLHFPSPYPRSLITQCMACLWKQYKSYWRNTEYSAVRLLFTIFTALIFGTVFWDLGSKTNKQQDLFNSAGSLYIGVLFLGVQNSSSIQPVVAVERTVFYRERGAGMYSALPYAFGQVTIEIPYVLVQTLLYGLIVYSMNGYEWTGAKFFWYLFIMYFTLLYFTFYGMMAIAMVTWLNAVYHMPTTENDMPAGSIPLGLQSLFYKLQSTRKESFYGATNIKGSKQFPCFSMHWRDFFLLSKRLMVMTNLRESNSDESYDQYSEDGYDDSMRGIHDPS